MAYGIPLPRRSAEIVNESFNGVNDLMNKLRQHALEQQKLQEMSKFHGQDIGLRKQASQRLQQLLGPQLQEYADKHAKAQPGYQAQQFLANREMLRHALSQMSGGQIGGSNQPQSFNSGPNDPNTGILNGEHAVNDQGIPEQGMQNPNQNINQQSAPQAQQNNQNRMGIDWNNPIDAQAAQLSGIKMPGETPEQKRAGDLETNKSKLQQAYEFKVKEAADKEMKGYKESVEDYQSNLSRLAEAKKIIQGNPDLWGHANAEDFSRVTQNPKYGYLMRQSLPGIIDTERMINARGTNLALKTSQDKYPTAKDSQATALGKIDAAIDEYQEKLAKSLVKTDPNGSTKAYWKGRQVKIPNNELIEFLKDRHKGASLIGSK